MASNVVSSTIANIHHMFSNRKKTPGAAPAARGRQGIIKQPLQAVGFIPVEGVVTPLMKKSMVAFVHEMQQNGKDQETYRAPLQTVAATTRFTSRNMEVLREAIRRLVSTRVEWQVIEGDRNIWGTSSFLSQVQIVVEGRTGYVEFSIPPRMRKTLLDPSFYAKIPVEQLMNLDSYAEMTLYEVCKRYATNPTRLTGRAAPEAWADLLSGRPAAKSAEPFVYKYFKRDRLVRLTKKLNKVTDIDVELIEHKHGKRVVEIQFRVSEKSQRSLSLGAKPSTSVDPELFNAVVALGIQETEVVKLFVDYDFDLIRATLDLTHRREKNQKQPKLDSPAAYFKASLKGGYGRQLIEQQEAKQGASKRDLGKKASEHLQAAYLDHRGKEARKLYAEMNQ